jgi:hypothetical protein
MVPERLRAIRSAVIPYLQSEALKRKGSASVQTLVLIQLTKTDSVLSILSPIAISFTVSMNAELIIPG